MDHVTGSVIRRYGEIAAANPNMISFSNGNPAASTFPTEKMRTYFEEALGRSYDPSFLKYGTARGYQPLIDALKKRLYAQYHFDWDNNDLFIVSGGTQSADIVSKLFLNAKDTVIVEEPSYSSIFNVFRFYEANLKGVPLHSEGMDLDTLEKLLQDGVKVIYTIPSFQNPSGFTMDENTRKRMYELACAYDAVILEDDPYSELRFSKEPVSPIKSLDTDGRVFYSGSFSKTLAPAFRLGYLVFNKKYSSAVTFAKQCTDMFTNTLTQYVAYRIMTDGDYDNHISNIQNTYRHKAELMRETLTANMHSSFTLSNPQGGMFMMLFTPEHVTGEEFVEKAIQHGVVCIPGSGFMLNGSADSHCVRLCYASASDEDIVKGCQILAKLTNAIG